MTKRSEYEQEQIQQKRDLSVYKRDDMVQKARIRLSVQEQRAVLYAISQIKPTDTHFTEYCFDINEFYKIIGWEKQSYHEFKLLLKGLADKSWWAEIDDIGTESVVRWFSIVRTNHRSGKVTIKFHEEMMPFLLQVSQQEGSFYTFYNLKYVLPMSSKHSPRLYEILKSYQKNNTQWFFDINELKYLLDCENYKNYTDFKRFVLSPAVEEINKYTDLSIAYKEIRTNGRGRPVIRVEFYMDKKTNTELRQVDGEISDALDGQTSLFDEDEIRANVAADPKFQFYDERREAKQQEQEQRDQIKAWLESPL